jgi:hypothetical protein
MCAPCRLVYALSSCLLGVVGCASNGGSSGGQLSGSQQMQIQQLCVQACMKTVSCADAGNVGADCAATCAANTMGDGGVPPDCNVDQEISGSQACIQGGCEQLAGCLAQVGPNARCSGSSEAPESGTGVGPGSDSAAVGRSDGGID